METLYKLTAAGLPLFDLNTEYLARTDWSKTPIGARHTWLISLACLVNAIILPIPHPSAIFWGEELAIVHNLAWGKSTGKLDRQGGCADDMYSKEALISLQKAIGGTTLKVACKAFLPSAPEWGPDATVLLSPLLDDKGNRKGVLAQLLHNLPLAGIDGLARKKLGRQTKFGGNQQPPTNDSEHQVDAKQTQLFQRFAELVPNGLAILDSDAEAVFVNDGFFALTTNKTSKDFRAWPQSIDPVDYERVMSAYRKAFSSRQELRVEFRCAGEASAEEREWRLFLLRPLSEDPEAGFICAVVDITEIKQAQLTQEKAAIEARDRKEQQERFIDMVSHEIRNPLSAVLHLAEEVKEIARELTTTSEAQDKIAEIIDAADTILLCVSHQNTLVDDILSFSKLDSMMLSLVPREVRPKWEFSNALKVFHSELKAKEIKFHYAMDVSYDETEVDYVVADLNRMKQVLVNLITNAIKFTAKKDGEKNITVTMGASNERPTSYPPNVIYFGHEDKDFHIDSTKSAEWGAGSPFYLMVAVKDTGIGISADNQKKLFERFRQATPKTQEKYGGSGLGLFISRKLCQLHGGDVGVSSKDGEGSTFGFFFKVRRSDGTSHSGRPPFGTNRTTSDIMNPATQAQNTKRPPYKRAISTLQNINEYKERHKARTDAEETESHGGLDSEEVGLKLGTLTSRSGVDPEKCKPEDKDPDDMNLSIKNPPTESHDASHPKANEYERTRQTQSISEQVNREQISQEQVNQEQVTLASSLNPPLPDITSSGEGARQKNTAEFVSKLQSDQHPKVRGTVLLVEDNLINQKVLRRQLQARGFEVFIANDGQEAVDMVEARGKVDEANPQRRNYFDCILMDQEMPVMDGNTATEEIRKLQKQGRAGNCPILGVSANVRQAQTKSMLESGMDAVISKPFKVDDLVKKIRSLLLSLSTTSKDKERETMDDKENAKVQLPKPEIQISEPEIQRPRPESEQKKAGAVGRTDGLDQEKPVVKEEKLAITQAKQKTQQGEPETRHKHQEAQQQQSEAQLDTPKTQQLYKESKQEMDKSRREAGEPQHLPASS